MQLQLAREVLITQLKGEPAPPSATSSTQSAAPGLLIRGNAILESAILDSIDEAIEDLLGADVRDAIYDNLERRNLLPKIELPNHLDIFCQLLDETFGRGSRTIERAIARRLYKRLGLDFTVILAFNFNDYLEVATRRVSESSKSHLYQNPCFASN